MLRPPYTEREVRAIDLATVRIRAEIAGFRRRAGISAAVLALAWLGWVMPLGFRLAGAAEAEASAAHAELAAKVERLRVELWTVDYPPIWRQFERDVAGLQRDVVDLRHGGASPPALTYPMQSVLRSTDGTSGVFVAAFDTLVDRRAVAAARLQLFARLRETMITRLQMVQAEARRERADRERAWRAVGIPAHRLEAARGHQLEQIEQVVAEMRKVKALADGLFPKRFGPMLADPSRTTRLDPAFPGRARQTLERVAWQFFPRQVALLSRIDGVAPWPYDVEAHQRILALDMDEGQIALLPPPISRLPVGAMSRERPSPPVLPGRDQLWITAVVPLVAGVAYVVLTLQAAGAVRRRRELDALARSLNLRGHGLSEGGWEIALGAAAALCAVLGVMAFNAAVFDLRALGNGTPRVLSAIQIAELVAMALATVVLLATLAGTGVRKRAGAALERVATRLQDKD